MISNLGSGPDATHTNYESAPAFQAQRSLEGCMPLIHPPQVFVNKKADSDFYKKMYHDPFFTRTMRPVHLFLFNGPFRNFFLTKKLLVLYRGLKASVKIF